MNKKTTSHIFVTQIKSKIGGTKNQANNLLGLGLRKVGNVRKLQDTPSVRGMINRVHHLVKVHFPVES